MDLWFNISWMTFTAKRKITKCVNSSDVSLLCIQGVGGKKHISKGNCMERVIITNVTQQHRSFTYLMMMRRMRSRL